MSPVEVAQLDLRLIEALRPALAGRAGVLLAVSGGPDSTALLHAAARCEPAPPLLVATVDHGLRSDAAREAEQVAALAARLGLPHRVLVWEQPERTSGIQAAARRARYRLLAEHARGSGADAILTAHTADDQAETVLMRLVAGSGPAGLAGMARERDLMPGVRLVRPFLDIVKADLVAYCHAHALAYAVDPSNVDERYGRARLRALQPMLARQGLTNARLCRLAERAARDASALAVQANTVFVRVAQAPSPGGIVLDGALLAAQPPAVILRVLARAFADMAGPDGSDRYARLEKLERLTLGDVLPALQRGQAIRRTLGGVLIAAARDGTITLARAPPRRGNRDAVG